MQYPFHWLEDATVDISVSTSSNVGALLKMPIGKVQIRLANIGSSTVRFRKGTAVATTALVTDMAIPAGAVEVLTLNNTEKSPITHIAAITASGTSTLSITTGTGI